MFLNRHVVWKHYYRKKKSCCLIFSTHYFPWALSQRLKNEESCYFKSFLELQGLVMNTTCYRPLCWNQGQMEKVWMSALLSTLSSVRLGGWRLVTCSWQLSLRPSLPSGTRTNFTPSSSAKNQELLCTSLSSAVKKDARKLFIESQNGLCWKEP